MSSQPQTSGVLINASTSPVSPIRAGMSESQPQTEKTTGKFIEKSQENPKSVNPRLWEKFQALKQRRETACKKSTEKRIARIQADVLNKVQLEITHEEDISVLKDHGVHLPEFDKNPKETRDKTKSAVEEERLEDSSTAISKPSTSSEVGGCNNEVNWNEVKQYIGANDRLKPIGKGPLGPKNSLEQKLDRAIEEGDMDTAEKLSDRIALQKFGVQVSEAFDAKKFIEKRKMEEETIKSKKKAKLLWGFDHKQKWETKSNM